MFEFLFPRFEPKPRWREEFELRIGDLELRTGMDRRELMKVADAIEQLKIIRL
jgi:hypothetical protein